MLAKRIAVLLILSIASLVRVEAQLGDQGLVRWDLIIPDAIPFGGGYRTYAEQPSLRLTFIVDNESTSPVLIDEAKLRKALSLIVFNSDRAQIPTILHWLPQVRLATADEATITDLVSSITVQPRSSAGWSLSVERSDGQLFGAGQYGIVPTTSGFPMAVRTAGGDPWQGRARDGSGGISLVVTPPRNARELSTMHIESALQAMRRRQPARAVEEYEQAVAADPTNPDALFLLAGAYSSIQWYQQAITAYEQLLQRNPSSAEQVKAVSPGLAFAYVAAGDEVSAARVLQNAGVPEERISAALDELRQNAARVHGR